jgi:hypothetical protein
VYAHSGIDVEYRYPNRKIGEIIVKDVNEKLTFRITIDFVINAFVVDIKEEVIP